MKRILSCWFLTHDEPSSPLGKVDFSSLTQQTLMEMVISEVQDSEAVKDSDGMFLDIVQWEGVGLDANGDVKEVCFLFESLYGIELE